MGGEPDRKQFSPGEAVFAARVTAVERLCSDVVAIDLEPIAGEVWPEPPAGAHIDVHLTNGLIRQYSLLNPSARGARYRIAVRRDEAGRGGSRYVHEALSPGMILTIGRPRDGFPFVAAARYVFIAGGIGITPLLGMATLAHQTGSDLRFYYCTRTEEQAAFRSWLTSSEFADSVTFVHDGGDPRRGLDLATAIGPAAAETHLYCCGPRGLMQAVEARALAVGWPAAHLHFESFSPAAPSQTSKAFTVRIDSTGEVLVVPEGTTLLEALRDAGHAVDSSCEQGICGTCRVGVLAGEPEHRDEVLSETERQSGTVMMACVSRSRSAELVLDL